jgi:hypothetical protein
MKFKIIALITCKFILVFIPLTVCVYFVDRYLDRRKARNVGIVRNTQAPT